jgi:hypothetical protein
MTRSTATLSCVVLALVTLACKQEPPRTNFAFPSEALAPPWLAELASAQIAAVEASEVRADFQFTDRRLESGISFRHTCLPDSGKDWRPVHYDHGNSVSVADIDGDGHTDLYFTNQAGPNELWRNLGDGRFEDWTARSGVALGDRVSVAASFADVDNDGDPDLYVTAVRAPNVYFENQGDGSFKDATDASGLGHEGHSSGAVFFDYDRDGLLDLFLAVVGRYTYSTETEEVGGMTVYRGRKDAFGGHLRPNRTERSRLFHNLGGGRFEDVTEQLGLLSDAWTGDATATDVNGDGWPDLYVLSMQGHDEYWQNEGGKRFIERGREVFGKTPWGAMGIKVFDMDNDGDQDLFLTDMHSDMSIKVDVAFEKDKSDVQWTESFLQTGGQSIWGNALFRNDGNMEFSEVSDAMGTENYWPWGLSAADLNADGFEDVFVTSSMNYPFRYCVNKVLLNDGGNRFIDAEFALGVEPRRDGRTAQPWFDLDCSGSDREHSRCAELEGQFTLWAALGSRSSAIFDLDADGDLDVVTNDFNSEPMVLISDLASRSPAPRWLTVQLRGSRSNRSGIGARVEVTAGEASHVKVHDGKSGYLAQSDQPLYFGLRDRGEVDRIVVTWPSGTTQTIDGPIKADQALVIDEPSGIRP